MYKQNNLIVAVKVKPEAEHGAELEQGLKGRRGAIRKSGCSSFPIIIIVP